MRVSAALASALIVGFACVAARAVEIGAEPKPAKPPTSRAPKIATWRSFTKFLLCSSVPTRVAGGRTTLTMYRQAQGYPSRPRHCQVRCCGALAHYLGDVVVDPADIDDMDPRLGRQIAIVEHRHRGAILVGGSDQVGAANPFDIPHVGRAASPRQPNADDTVPASRSQSCRERP